MKYFLVKEASIQTYDNPGWGIYIYFKEEIAKERERIKLQYNSEKDWLYIYKDKDYLQFGGDEKKLASIYLEIINLVEIKICPNKAEILGLLRFLQNWYTNECDGYWEHLYGVRGTIANNRFELTIDLDDTDWEDKTFTTIKTDQYICEKTSTKFQAEGEVNSILTCLEHFKNWIEEE